MKTLLLLLAAAALVIVGVVAAGPIRGAFTAAGEAVSPDDTMSSEGAPADAGGVTLYQSGMHPWIITTEPGNCPICGMKLEPIDPAKLTGEIAIDPVVVQNIGVRTAEVVRGPAVQTLRTVGTVEVAEPNVHDVNLRVSGWIEDLFVDFEGAEVEAGEELFTLYSPQLYAAAEEYLLAVGGGGGGGGPDADDPLSGSARDRLLNLGLTQEQVDALEEAGTAERNVPIVSPAAGTVTQKHANEGMNVQPGMLVFRIVDLSTVWVQVTLYESQLQGVRPGQPATMTVAGLPGETFEGEVAFVDPTLDPRTRSVRARLVFQNPEDRLKPGMFADVTLRTKLAEEAVLAPREAVVETGTRKLVFVAKGGGRFEPREVETAGNVADGMVRIASGLEPGEDVVTSGQFLLDSEASVRSSLARMIDPGGGMGAPATPASSTMESMDAPSAEAVTPAVQAGIDRLAEAYLGVQAGLTRNEASGLGPVAEAAAAVAAAAEGRVAELAAAVAEAADGVPAGADAAAVRGAFDPLSLALIDLFETAPPSPSDGGPVRGVALPDGREELVAARRGDPQPLRPLDAHLRLGAADAAGTHRPRNHARSGRCRSGGRRGHGPVAEAYLALQENLTRNEPAGVTALANAARTLAGGADEPAAGLASAVAEAADRVPADADPAAVRGAFEEISHAVIALLEATPAGGGGDLAVAHCPMVDKDWLQAGTAIRNPYDPSMLSCGTVLRTLPEGAADAR